MTAQELTTVEPETVSEEGSTPPLKPETVLKGDPEPVSSEPPASDDVPTTIQDAEPVSALAESVAAVEVPEPAKIEDSEPADEAPTVDMHSEHPSDVFDTSLDQVRLAQPVEEETARPKSPWTPSYTVTTLPGSGSSPRVGSNPELNGTPAVEADTGVVPVEKVEVSETPKIVTPPDEEPAEPTVTTGTPWTQSYSVISQPGSPRVSPRAELEQLEPEPQPVESSQETIVAPPIVELTDVPKTVVTPAVEDEDEDVVEPAREEESKPTWAQSYSVTSQPGSPRVSPKQVPEEIPEAEETKPSWTQSYSVTSQPGSPRVLPKEDLPESTVEPVSIGDEPTTAVVPPVQEAAPAPVEAEAPERPKSPWTPSYSATTLEAQTEQVRSEDAEPVQEVVSIPQTFVGEVPEPKKEVDALITDTPEPLAVKDERPERPESSWTTSYSVTTVPGSAPADEPELHSVADEPSVDVEVPAPEPVEVVKAVEDHPKGDGTTSDVFEVHEALVQLSVHGEHLADIETTEPTPQLDLVSYGCFI